MQAAVEIAGIATVGALSIAFALLVEWLSLWGLMRLLPPSQAERVVERTVPVRARRLRPQAASR